MLFASSSMVVTEFTAMPGGGGGDAAEQDPPPSVRVPRFAEDLQAGQHGATEEAG